MDHFGIGAAILGAARIYFSSARGTGRTTSMIESVKDGDRIVVSSAREVSRLKLLLAERALQVSVLCIDPGDPGCLCRHATPEGRTIFDHYWVEQYYELALKNASHGIDRLQREFSGFGSAHCETKRKYEEMAKWSPY